MRKADEEVVDLLPRSVEIAIGDVGDPEAVKAAVEGCNKIIYCATARSTITADLNRVDYQGVYNTTKAFQVCPSSLSLFHSHIQFLEIHSDLRNIHYDHYGDVSGMLSQSFHMC